MEGATANRAARTLPLPEAFVLRALQMAKWDVWDD